MDHLDVLDAIQARADKATPGEWKVVPEMFRGGIYVEPTIDAGSYEDGEPRTVASIRIGLPETDANAIFIAAAREDVPRLVRALRAALAGLEVIEEQERPSAAGLAFQYRKAALAELGEKERA
jgi:hypothetical protein